MAADSSKQLKRGLPERSLFGVVQVTHSSSPGHSLYGIIHAHQQQQTLPALPSLPRYPREARF